MLFVALMRTRAGTEEERIARRLQWQNPEGLHVVAEYWLHTSNPQIVLIFNTESYVPISQLISAWDDIFDITVFPAVTAEEGLEQAREIM